MIKKIFKLGFILLCVTTIKLFHIASRCEYSNKLNQALKNEKEDISIPTGILQQQISRRRALHHYCKSKALRKVAISSYLIYSDNEKLIYCYIPKAASTTWKRLFRLFENTTTFENISMIDKNDIHRLNYDKLKDIQNYDERIFRENSYYSFLITRHPFERLIATFRNKFEDPYTSFFQKLYGSRILRKYRRNLPRDQIRAGAGVTFQEFIKYILSTRNYDEHWNRMTDICSPCSFKYDYIAKMETLVADSKAILESTGLHKRYHFLENSTDRYETKTSDLIELYFSNLSESDIIKLYKMYKDDFEAFEYTIPKFLDVTL